MKRCAGCGAVKPIQARSEFCSHDCSNKKQRGISAGVTEELEKKVKAVFDRSVSNAEGGKISLEKLCDKFDKAPRTINLTIESLSNQGFNFEIDGGEFKLSPTIPVTQRHEAVKIYHDVKDYAGGWRKIGACGDFHMGSRHERLDVVHSLYDMYEREGVTDVFNTGNWIEGEARFNYADIQVFGLDDQIDYFLKHMPQKKGITTHFVAGDDHEGWYQQKTRLIIGRHLQRKAEEIGRHDLKYIGYMEGHVEFPTKLGMAHMLVIHPGGGAAYATSYAPQKIAEAFQEGEKPDICLIGHYHKMDYGFHRGIHMVQTGTCQDQSSFMRKQKIKAHVGGTLIEFHQAPEGHINRFKPEFFTYFDRKFYAPKDRNFLGKVSQTQKEKSK
jgi:hypothetical protein